MLREDSSPYYVLHMDWLVKKKVYLVDHNQLDYTLH